MKKFLTLLAIIVIGAFVFGMVIANNVVDLIEQRRK